MVRRLVVSVILMLAAPSAAHAAQLSLSNGELRYTAGLDQVNDVTFDETSPGTVRVTRDIDEDADLIAISGVPGCTAAIVNEDYTCTPVTRIVADVRDHADRITATGLDEVTTSLAGGDGNDAIDSGAMIDTIDGGAGADSIDAGAGNDTVDGGADDDLLDGGLGNDTLIGGDGNDARRPDLGRDSIMGGDGIDTAVYGFRSAPTYTLDGLPNDGDTGENDLIGADVEGVAAAAFGSGVVTIVGDGRANRLTVTGGRGDLTGGEGSDVLEGGTLDDVLRSRDGSPDTVLCGAGTDTVEADTLDTISTTCDNVTRQATPGGPFDDQPPLLAWTAPGNGAALPANAPTILTVNATDDRGLARVQFFDDDRLLCDDTAAPYTCDYQPRGGDVGRNTLIAVAVDGAGQTTSVVRAVTVRRFTSPGFALSLRPSRDRRAPYAFRATGRLLRPPPVSPSQGCSGTVTITARAGARTVTRHRTPLSRTCEYTLTLHIRGRPASRLRLSARFGGNAVIAERTSRTRTVRLG